MISKMKLESSELKDGGRGGAGVWLVVRPIHNDYIQKSRKIKHPKETINRNIDE